MLTKIFFTFRALNFDVNFGRVIFSEIICIFSRYRARVVDKHFGAFNVNKENFIKDYKRTIDIHLYRYGYIMENKAKRIT